MRVSIKSTTKVVWLVLRKQKIRARIWEGKDANGSEIMLFVVAAPYREEPTDNSEPSKLARLVPEVIMLDKWEALLS